MFHFQQTDLFEYKQLRFILYKEATGLLETVELSIEYQEENLDNVEVWVRENGDNVKGRIRIFKAMNNDVQSESFHQALITQVNDMPDINDYINTWVSRRQNERKHRE